MEKPNTALVWLVLFSLVTTGFGQALMITAAPAPQAVVPNDRQIIPSQMARALSSLLKTSAAIPWSCQIFECEL